MPMNDDQIERAIEQILATEVGALFGPAENAGRVAAGNHVFDAISEALNGDVRAAGEEGQAIDAPAR